MTDALNVLGYKVVFLKDSTEIQSLPSSLGSLWCVRRHTRKSNTSHCFPKDYVDLQEFKVSTAFSFNFTILGNIVKFNTCNI